MYIYTYSGGGGSGGGGGGGRVAGADSTAAATFYIITVQTAAGATLVTCPVLSNQNPSQNARSPRTHTHTTTYLTFANPHAMQTTQVEHRYSEFDALRKRLEKEGLRTDAPFPRKDPVRKKVLGLSDNIKDQRRLGLHRWLNKGVA